MEAEIIEKAREFFKTEFVDEMVGKMESGHSLASFHVNPFLATTLSNGILGGTTPLNMAKALLYPRILGTSASTQFGDKFQKFCITVIGARASGVPGMDIEFEDKIDGGQMMVQVKSGPNTINSGDVEPILQDMRNAHRLLVTNRTNQLPKFAIGIVYGTHDEISYHYRRIERSSVGNQMSIPILTGKDFWHRLTGDENFYGDLVVLFVEAFEEKDYQALFEKDLRALAREIEIKYFTGGKLDLTKI